MKKQGLFKSFHQPQHRSENEAADNRQKHSFLRSLITNVLVGLVISFSILYFIDQVYLTSSDEPIKKAVVPANIKDIPEKAQSLGFSYDNRSYMYIDDGELFIKYIQDSSMQKSIVEKNPIVAAFPMDDRNIVFYFTVDKDVPVKEQKKVDAQKPKYDPESNQPVSEAPAPAASVSSSVTDVIEVKTYNLDTGESISQQSIKVTKFEKIDMIDYSSLTNVIYLKITNKNKSALIYRINIMKNVSLYTSASSIENIALLKNEDSLYYQKGNSVLFNKKTLSGTKEKSRLLAAGKDYAYITSEENPNIIYKYKGQDRSGEIAVSDSGYKSAFENRGRVFLIYDDHMAELTGDAAKKIKFKDNAEFIAVSNGVLYTQKQDGTVISQKIR